MILKNAKKHNINNSTTSRKYTHKSKKLFIIAYNSL